MNNNLKMFLFDRVRGLLIENNSMLFMKRIKKGVVYMVAPGGGREDDETNEAALVREFKEETNLSIVVEKFVFEDYFDGQRIGYYLVRKTGGKMKFGGPEKKTMNIDNQYFLEWIDLTTLKNQRIFPV